MIDNIIIWLINKQYVRDELNIFIMWAHEGIYLQNPIKNLKKTANESKAETTLMMLPSDANPKGNVFGGVILKHVDLIAGIVAKRHANQSNVVTASIDRMTFIKPIFIGNSLILEARLNYVKRSSMEIEVNIFAEDLDYNIRVHAGRAYVTTVSIDKYGNLWKFHSSY